MEALPFYDTAGAAKMLAETMPGASAVIANKICSRIYGLKIIKDNIGKKSLNHTRFVLLSKERNKEEGNKCSIAFISDGKDGELFNVLKLFSDAGISLIQVVSRPSTKKMGKTITLIDLKGSINDKNIAGTLAVLEKKSIIYKLLGCYKEASPIGDQDLQPVI
jgi:prephenate dehydratase